MTDWLTALELVAFDGLRNLVRLVARGRLRKRTVGGSRFGSVGCGNLNKRVADSRIVTVGAISVTSGSSLLCSNLLRGGD